jgi:cysteinyl-tRNA synthetase
MENTLKLYNTLSRKKEEFKPLKKGKVGLYTCGPTVYNFAHLGNLRAYLFDDLLKRVLLYDGYEVKHVTNITDVGHLTGDRDMGEDKLETGARREGKSAWEIAEFYTDAFKKDIAALNILPPDIYCKATDHIKEQIDLIKVLEKKDYTYRTSDGIYFDTSKVKDYNKLSHLKLEELKEGARVEKNPEKKNPTDFALWKFSHAGEKRQMEWDSPWGVGFPGWHIECSAMAIKYLGKQFDIHCGGIDHINIHHTNEIAQSEAATGKKPWVNYWLHNAFLNIAGGKKMAKSDDNFLTLENALVKKGLSPLVYRYAALQTHYRKPMEYSEAAIRNAENGLSHIENQVKELGNKKGKINLKYQKQFTEKINDDLNTPDALAVIQEALKDNQASNEDKLATILNFDQVLGLKLNEIKRDIPVDKMFSTSKVFSTKAPADLPDEILKILQDRRNARMFNDWPKSDRLREELESRGFIVKDTKDGQTVSKK